MKKETTKPKTTPKAERPAVKTIDQMTLARQIAHKYEMTLSEVLAIIEEEQKLTMEYARLGYKVIKKNYLTIESKPVSGKKGWVSPLTKKTYDIAPTQRVMVRVGEGFKQYVADRQMPKKLCRFVSSPTVQAQAATN